MTQPAACVRCHGTELVSARFEAPGIPRLVVDKEHESPVLARVCVACGAVQLTATLPAALRTEEETERDVQEYDF